MPSRLHGVMCGLRALGNDSSALNGITDTADRAQMNQLVIRQADVEALFHGGENLQPQETVDTQMLHEIVVNAESRGVVPGDLADEVAHA